MTPFPSAPGRLSFFPIDVLMETRIQIGSKNMILNISDISKAFDGKDVLRGVSFHIEEH